MSDQYKSGDTYDLAINEMAEHLIGEEPDSFKIQESDHE